MEGERRISALIDEISWNRDLISHLPNHIVLHAIWSYLKQDILHSNGMDEQRLVVLLSLLNVNKAWIFLVEKYLGGLALKVHGVRL